MAKTMQQQGPRAAGKMGELTDKVQGSQAWNSIFRPGSIFRKGYTDSPRNRSYVIMNSRAVPPAPGEGEAPRGQGQLHALPRRAELLPLHPADGHRHLPDVLLPADRGPGLERHLHAADLGDLRPAGAEHAPMGRPPHGAVGVPAHGPRLLPRRLQAAPGVQLGDRRDPAHAHPAALLHRLPAAVGPAGAVGGDRGHEHDGLHAGVRRTRCASCCSAARRSAPTRCCAGTCCTC